MKKIALLFSGLFLLGIAGISQAQTPQVNNSGFEDWENVGSATEEPLEWNSFKTGSGSLINYTSKQIQRSTVVRPGTSGAYSCVTWSKLAPIGGIIANGLITTGQVNADNMTPSDPSNYNITHTAQTAFSETLGANPDSIVVWVKFKPANAGGSDSARIHVFIHDTYDVKDPADAGSLPQIVGEATLNFASTNDQWERKSIPFIYTGPASSPDFILINMTTNKSAGAGSGGDSLYIDDMELIYNGVGINNINSSENFKVYTDANDLIINLAFDKPLVSEISVYNITGQIVYKTQIEAQNTQKHIGLSQFEKGFYIVNVSTDDGRSFSQKVSLN